MAKRPPLADYIVKPEKDDLEACALGLYVLYQYEPADHSVGINEAYWITAVKVDGLWLSPDAFNEIFLDRLSDAIGDAVREEAAEDFDIPEEVR